MKPKSSQASSAPRATPDAGNQYRVTLSLPATIATQLRDTASNLGMSQSALVAALLQDSIGPLHKLSKRAGSLSDSDSVKRFRGDSIDLILKHVAKVLRRI